MCTTVVEVTKNIHDTLIMPHDIQCQSQPHKSLQSSCHDKDTERYWFMTKRHNKDILNNVCIQNAIIE